MSRDDVVAGYTIVVNREGLILVTSLTDIAGLGQNLRHPRDPEEFNSVESVLEILGWELTEAIRPIDGDGNAVDL